MRYIIAYIANYSDHVVTKTLHALPGVAYNYMWDKSDDTSLQAPIPRIKEYKQ